MRRLHGVTMPLAMDVPPVRPSSARKVRTAVTNNEEMGHHELSVERGPRSPWRRSRILDPIPPEPHGVTHSTGIDEPFDRPVFSSPALQDLPSELPGSSRYEASGDDVLSENSMAVGPAVDTFRPIDPPTMADDEYIFAMRAYNDVYPSYSSFLNFLRVFVSTITITLGIREHPLQPGVTRLRWECVCISSVYDKVVTNTNDQKICGEPFHGDFRELREGGIPRLIARMQLSSCVNIVASNPHGPGTNNAKYTFPLPRFARNFARRASAAFNRLRGNSQGLPQHTSRTGLAAGASSGVNHSTQQTLHMMACMQRGYYRRVV